MALLLPNQDFLGNISGLWVLVKSPVCDESFDLAIAPPIASHGFYCTLWAFAGFQLETILVGKKKALLPHLA